MGAGMSVTKSLMVCSNHGVKQGFTSLRGPITIASGTFTLESRSCVFFLDLFLLNITLCIYQECMKQNYSRKYTARNKLQQYLMVVKMGKCNGSELKVTRSKKL